MSEWLQHEAEPTQETTEETTQETTQETTGDETVDGVIASLRSLDDLPVSEHVAVFERAHESLRRVLSGAGEPVSQG